MRTLLTKTGYVLSLIFGFVAFSAFGNITNDVALLFEPSLYKDLEHEELSQKLFERIGQEFTRNEDAVTSKIGISASMKWAQRFQGERYDYHETVNSSGRDAALRLLEDSAKEAALATLPVGELEERGRLIGKFFLSLFQGSFGNTVEERAYENSGIDQGPGESEVSWWKKLQEEGTIKYGVRPFRPDPYAYFGTKVGSWGDYDQPYFILENRIGYKAFDCMRLKSTVMIPLLSGFYIYGYIAADILKESGEEENISASLRFEKVIGKKSAMKSLYAGIKTDEYHTFSFIGFNTRW